MVLYDALHIVVAMANAQMVLDHRDTFKQKISTQCNGNASRTFALGLITGFWVRFIKTSEC